MTGNKFWYEVFVFRGLTVYNWLIISFKFNTKFRVFGIFILPINN